jgi:cyanate lyase
MEEVDFSGAITVSNYIILVTKGGFAMYRIEILERKRLEKGLSYTEIADKLGIHKVTVSRTLKGVTMKPRTVKLLADYLSVEMEKLVA